MKLNKHIKEIIMNDTEELLLLYSKRKKLYLKGGNDEKLNEKIRELQKSTNYKIKEQ